MLPFVLLVSAGLACNFPKLRIPDKAMQVQASVSAQPESTESHIALSTADPGETELILKWQGTLPGDPLSCHRLEVTNEHQARYGPCSEPLQVAAFNPSQWDEMVLRTAPFELSTPETMVTFRGQGKTSGPAWERAVAHWAQNAYAALYTGHACAACNTVLNWSFGEEPAGAGVETCLNLWVTDYGYAYLGVAPCQGGQTVIQAQGWLETGEWAQLDAWLSCRGELHLGETGASYLLGRGTQEMSADEQTQLAAWSHGVKNRLAATGQ